MNNINKNELVFNYVILFCEGLAASFYMPETIRSEIYERNDDVFLQADMRQYPGKPFY